MFVLRRNFSDFPQMFNCLILCLLIVVLVVHNTTLPSLGQEGLYQRAVKEYESRHYEQAARLFDQYISTKLPGEKLTSTQLPLASETPTVAYAIFYEAVCLEQIGDLKNAITLYKLIVYRYRDTKLALEAKKMLQRLPNSQSTVQKPAVPARDPGLDSLPKETWVPFKRFGNLMLVDGSINGKNTGMLFDTGASGCLFSTKQLKSLGIEIPTGAPTAAVAGIGVNKQTPAWIINADIRLGRIERRKFPIQINDNPLNYPLLVMNFVDGLEYTIDNDAKVIQFKSIVADKGANNSESISGQQAGERVELHTNENKAITSAAPGTQSSALSNDRTSYSGTKGADKGRGVRSEEFQWHHPDAIVRGGAEGTEGDRALNKMFIVVDSSSHYVYNIPFSETNRAIIVKAKVAGKDCRMILDTGTDICLFTTYQLKTLGILPRYTGRMLGCKGAAGYTKAPLCLFEKAEFGPISGPMTCLVTDDAYLPLPLLGQNFLKGWQLTVDHASHLIKLIRK